MEGAFLRLLEMDRARSGGWGVVRCWVGAVADAGRGIVMRLGPQGPHASRTGKWGGEVMSTVVADFRYALRSLARRPVFATTAILTIAIGIGANASVFTVVNGFMLRPLPYQEPHELVALFAANHELGWSGTDVNPADVVDWGRRATSLEAVTVYQETGFNLTGGDVPELVSALRVMPNFLSVVGWQPTLGRDFTSDEMGAGRDDSVILMDGFWERRFARDHAVLGSTLTLDGAVVTVIGILPPDFQYYDMRADLLRPWAVDVATVERGGHYAEAMGRLAPGVTIDTAREELDGIAHELAAEFPQNVGWTAEVIDLKTEVLGPVAPAASVVLMGAVGFILLMACVNVANLLLARGGTRAREIAVRIALGAGRGRIVRQLLTESVVLAVIGALAGLAAANWAYRAIVAALPPNMPPIFQFEMDTTVLLFTAGITVGAAMLFGVLPALRVTADQGGTLRDGGRSGGNRRASRFGSALVVLQTAMAVVLLVGGGLLMKSIAGMRAQDFGFDPQNVLTARISLPTVRYESREASDAYWREVAARVAAVPGVVSVGTTQSHPLMGSNWGRTLRVAGQDRPEDESLPVRLTIASEGLFESLGFEMARGRVFNAADVADAPPVAIVNEAFIRQYLGPDDDPLAQTLLGSDWEVRVVGVVRDVVERGVDEPPEPALYVPTGQYDLRTRSLVMRTAGDPRDLVGAVQDAVWSVDADIPVYDIQTMEALVDDRVGGFAVIGSLMGVFALLSLILGAVGIYGVTAYAAGQRTSEIGVRLAMGAERTDVVAMVVREGGRLTAIGLAIGLVLAVGLGGAMSSILVGVSPRDPVTFGSVVVVLALVSFGGLYIPAKRASRVDPVTALASE